MTHVLGYMKPLKKEHDEQLDFFTALIKKNNDYDQFTLEQKDRLNFGVTLGFVLRELARTDIIIKNGNVPIINTSAAGGLCPGQRFDACGRNALSDIRKEEFYDQYKRFQSL